MALACPNPVEFTTSGHTPDFPLLSSLTTIQLPWQETSGHVGMVLPVTQLGDKLGNRLQFYLSSITKSRLSFPLGMKREGRPSSEISQLNRDYKSW
jgi:hypothetical protein